MTTIVRGKNKMRNIYITGGAGYVGARLVPALLEKGYGVTVLDLMIYGEDVLDSHPNLHLIKGDIRDQALLRKTLPNHDVVIHLACISNDPSFELNPLLGRAINLDAFEPLVKCSIEAGVTQFLYASSSSVYGVKSEPFVHEEMTLEPLTDYSKFKAECEDILQKYGSSDFSITSIRPATVCGYSRRQRLDVVVNILSNLAFHNREITVFGGSQLRPNIHIDDMVNSYISVLESSRHKVNGKIFNVGFENKTVLELSNIVKKVIGEDVKLKFVDTNDNRSYHISSSKIQEELGFMPSYSIEQAVVDIRNAFVNGSLKNTLTDERFFNIKRMQSISLK